MCCTVQQNSTRTAPATTLHARDAATPACLLACSHTRVQKLRESVQPRVISLTASGGGSGELAPLKSVSEMGAIHRGASSNGSSQV